MDTNGSQKEPVSRGATAAGGPADRGATEGCVDRHTEVVSSHVLVVEVSLPPSAQAVGSTTVIAFQFQAYYDNSICVRAHYFYRSETLCFERSPWHSSSLPVLHPPEPYPPR